MNEWAEIKHKTRLVDLNALCECSVFEQKPALVNYDMMHLTGHLICDDEKGGCGKFIRHWETG